MVDETLLARAREVAVLARGLGDDIEQNRRLPPTLVDSLRDSQLFNLWLPKSLGGLDADLATFFQVVETVSSGDPAAGWVLMIAAETNSLATWMPAEARGRIFAAPRPPICVGTLNPAAGVARTTNGGYVVRGQWPLASGVRHADWVISRCRLQSEGGTVLVDENGSARTIAVATPASDVSPLDNWQTSGLLGTGSEDYLIDDVFVPESLAFDFGRAQFDGPRASLPLRLHFQVGHAAHALGTVTGALEAFRELTAGGRWRDRPAAELALAYRSAAEAEALTRSARAWMADLLDSIWTTAEAGTENPVNTWPVLTLAVAHTVRTCVRAADLLFEAAGAGALYRANRLERFWRDMRAAGQHLHAKERHYSDVGRLLYETPS